MEEEEFLREFDEITIGYPVTEAGHLQSLYTGRTASRSRLCSMKLGACTGWHTGTGHSSFCLMTDWGPGEGRWILPDD